MAHSSYVPGDSHALRQAVACAHHGLCVHPLAPRSKKPALLDWQSLATTDETTLHTWARWFPGANWGVVLGERSGALVIEVNRRQGGEASLRAWETQYGPLPSTWQVQSADGVHCYFQHPGGHVHFGALAPGLQVLGDHHNVVLPGSVHPSGYVYTWRDGYDPANVPLAALSARLQEQLHHRGLWVSASLEAPTGASAFPYHSKSKRDQGGEKCTCTAAGGERRFPLQGPWTPQRLWAELGHFDVVQRVFPVCGIPATVEWGKNFCCPLHPESTPSVVLLPPRVPGEPPVFAHYHPRESDRTIWPLTNLFFSTVTGQPLEQLATIGEASGCSGKPTYILWMARMLMWAGVLPSPPSAPPLSVQASTTDRQVWAGIWEMRWLRRLLQYWAPFPLTERFLASWCGVSRATARKAVQWLVDGERVLERSRQRYKLPQLGMRLFYLARDAQMLRRFKPRFWKRFESDRSAPLSGESSTAPPPVAPAAVAPDAPPDEEGTQWAATSDPSQERCTSGLHAWFRGLIARFCIWCNMHHGSCQCPYCVETRDGPRNERAMPYDPDPSDPPHRL
jgi:Bifunctional DNA primase/polymerase, N-terminal